VTEIKLAKLLADLRETKGYSLRDVQNATGVSNAYLSQLEQGKADKPAPDKLEAIARFYEIPYMELMRAAGYVQGNQAARDLTAEQVALMSANLSKDEWEQVMKFVKFLRYQDK
jgi:HTH-type transcriptional regulator, competence development regulator